MPVAKIYLPKDAEGYDAAASHVRQWFGHDHGGWTEYDGRGGWVNGDGETVTEPVTVFETVTDPKARYHTVLSVAKGVKQKTDESAVLTVFDGEKFVVDGD